MKKGVLASLTAITGIVTGTVVSRKICNNIIEQKEEKVDKFKTYYNLLNQWLQLKQNGKSLSEYFSNNKYNEIAVYGMGELGNRFIEELSNTKVQVRYAIDKKAASTYSDLKLIEPDDELEQVDAIVVTAIFAFEEVKELLSEKIDCPIISLEEIVYNI